MAIFGGSKKVFVSSVVYNLAGDINLRPDFLKTTVFAKAIDNSNSNMSMGEHVTTTYLNGPGIKLRSFARWARIYGYSDKVGMAPSTLTVGDDVDVAELKLQIPLVPPADDLLIQTAEIGVADYTYWVDQYMLENHPDLINTAYVANFDGTTITIVFADASVESFMPVGYDPFRKFLYATYTFIYPATTEPVAPGTVVELDPLDPFPSTAGWDTVSTSEVPTPYDLVTSTRVQVDYSNATPDTDNTTYDTVSGSYDEIHDVYELLTYKGQHPVKDATWSELEIMAQDQTGEVITLAPVVDVVVESIGGGHTKTTTTTVTEEVLELTKTYQIDTQEKINKEWGPTKALIYGYDTGNPDLDAMFGVETPTGIVFPFVPIRIDNRMISDTYFASDYPWVKKATKRALKMSFDRLVDKISDNPSLGDIDYAFMVFGVSLNTKDMSALAYLFEFFRQQMLGSAPGAGPILGFEAAFAAADASIAEWEAWKAAQSDPLDPLFGEPEPVILPYPTMPGYQITFASSYRTDLNFNYVITWAGATETTHSGLGRPGAKVGDYWWFDGGEATYPQKIYNGNEWIVGDSQTLSNMVLFWQDEPDSHKKLTIYNLYHRNNIYGSKTIEIKAGDAVTDPEESGFIIPLHESIYRTTPLVPATQMATACVYLVFNCIQIVKQKWYETTLFKILIVIVIIVVVIVTAGAAGPAAGGLLGTNLAVGSALGFVGATAVIVGAIANALAAMIVAQIIQYASTAIFGPQIGAIVGVIASMIAMNVGTALATGGSLATAFSNLVTPENLLQLTAAAGEGYSKYLQAQTAETYGKIQTMMTEIQAQTDEVEEKRQDLFGSIAGRGMLDPLALTNATFQHVPETRAAFLARTTMTGMDIADITVNLPRNFLTYTIDPTLPAPGMRS